MEYGDAQIILHNRRHNMHSGTMKNFPFITGLLIISMFLFIYYEFESSNGVNTMRFKVLQPIVSSDIQNEKDSDNILYAMAKDLLRYPPPKYLKDYKNPCFIIQANKMTFEVQNTNASNGEYRFTGM